MPDLYNQIGALYKVIVQMDSASSPAGSHRPAAWWNGSGRWICTCYCLWFSLPLSIWLSGGSIGLLLYWQVLSGAACLLEKFSPKQRPAFAAGAAGENSADYCPVTEFCPAAGEAR